MTTIDDTLESLANRLRAVQEQIALLKEVESDLKARTRDAIGDQRGTITANGKALFQVTYRKMWNEQQAQVVLAASPDLLARCMVLSGTKAKAELPPSIYAQCQVESTTPAISVKTAAA